MKTSRYYRLNESGQPIPCTLMELARGFEDSASRVVAKTKVGDSEVSTVFLGLDHNYNPSGPPILWETMVFGGSMDQEQTRCSGNREQAEAMHNKLVERVKWSITMP